MIAGSTHNLFVSLFCSFSHFLVPVDIRLVDDRLTSPSQLLSPNELRLLSSSQLADLRARVDVQPSVSVFEDGILLCELVARLLHTRLTGVVYTPTVQQQRSAPSQRAIALHNVELALNALRTNRRMPLTYLYREAATAIIHNDLSVIRPLLIDIRNAFPGVAH